MKTFPRPISQTPIILKALGPGMLGVFSPGYGNQVWMATKLTKKNQGVPCYVCEKPLGNRGYRPLTNLGNRGYRICVNCGKPFEPEESTA